MIQDTWSSHWVLQGRDGLEAGNCEHDEGCILTFDVVTKSGSSSAQLGEE